MLHLKINFYGVLSEIDSHHTNVSLKLIHMLQKLNTRRVEPAGVPRSGEISGHHANPSSPHILILLDYISDKRQILLYNVIHVFRNLVIL